MMLAWLPRSRARQTTWRFEMTTGAVGQGCPVHQSFDPLSPEYLADPYAIMTSPPLHETPVFFAPSIGY
jgi:hypothetical protein